MGKKAAMAVALALLVVLAAGAVVLLLRLEGQPPTVVVDGFASHAGANQALTLTLADPHSGLSTVRVELVKDGKQVVLVDRHFPGRWIGAGDHREEKIALAIDTAKLGDGEALLRISVRDHSWRHWFHGNPVLVEKPFRIDTRAPQIQVLSRAHNIRQGGAGLLVYRISETCRQSGVRVGEGFFPGVGGYFQDPLTMVCFFALSHEQGPGTRMAVEAEDLAGNAGRTGFIHHIRPRSFVKDAISLSEAFIQSAASALEQGRNDKATPLERFLAVNRDLRVENDRVVRQIGRNSEARLYWEGAFLRLPASAPRAGFGDRRDYIYQGTVVDQQVHLGVDLASLAQSPVPAANRGKVAHVGDLGIYGQTVIIDHGCGVMSMYAHLSVIDVQVGQVVEKGQPIGRTGATGLAAGDHLHFAMLVHDTFVTPVEWWDDHWITDNITTKLTEAGPVATGG